MSKVYSSEEIDRIIRRAQQRQMSDQVSHEELLRMANELGLDPVAVEAAAAAEADAREKERHRAGQRRKRQDKFKQHLVIFLIMMVFFFVLNLFTRGPFWFHWPLIGWGLAVALHFFSAYFPSRADLDRERD